MKSLYQVQDRTNRTSRITVLFMLCSLFTEQVEVTEVTMSSAVVLWTIPSLTEQQTYYVEYGSSVDSLDLTTDPITSETLLPDESYSVSLTGLDAGTTYYVRVVAIFSDVYLYSSTESFTTIALRKYIQQPIVSQKFVFSNNQ